MIQFSTSFSLTYNFSFTETRVINMELHYPFLYFSLDDILLLISCILTQQRIVFLSSSYSLFTPIIEVCVISLFQLTPLNLVDDTTGLGNPCQSCFTLTVQIYTYQRKKNTWPKLLHERWIWQVLVYTSLEIICLWDVITSYEVEW